MHTYTYTCIYIYIYVDERTYHCIKCPGRGEKEKKRKRERTRVSRISFQSKLINMRLVIPRRRFFPRIIVPFSRRRNDWKFNLTPKTRQRIDEGVYIKLMFHARDHVEADTQHAREKHVDNVFARRFLTSDGRANRWRALWATYEELFYWKCRTPTTKNFNSFQTAEKLKLCFLNILICEISLRMNIIYNARNLFIIFLSCNPFFISWVFDSQPLD